MSMSTPQQNLLPIGKFFDYRTIQVNEDSKFQSAISLSDLSHNCQIPVPHRKPSTQKNITYVSKLFTTSEQTNIEVSSGSFPISGSGNLPASFSISGNSNYSINMKYTYIWKASGEYNLPTEFHRSILLEEMYKFPPLPPPSTRKNWHIKQQEIADYLPLLIKWLSKVGTHYIHKLYVGGYFIEESHSSEISSGQTKSASISDNKASTSKNTSSASTDNMIGSNNLKCSSTTEASSSNPNSCFHNLNGLIVEDTENPVNLHFEFNAISELFSKKVKEIVLSCLHRYLTCNPDSFSIHLNNPKFSFRWDINIQKLLGANKISIHRPTQFTIEIPDQSRPNRINLKVKGKYLTLKEKTKPKSVVKSGIKSIGKLLLPKQKSLTNTLAHFSFHLVDQQPSGYFQFVKHSDDSPVNFKELKSSSLFARPISVNLIFVFHNDTLETPYYICLSTSDISNHTVKTTLSKKFALPISLKFPEQNNPSTKRRPPQPPISQSSPVAFIPLEPSDMTHSPEIPTSQPEQFDDPPTSTASFNSEDPIPTQIPLQEELGIGDYEAQILEIVLGIWDLVL